MAPEPPARRPVLLLLKVFGLVGDERAEGNWMGPRAIAATHHCQGLEALRGPRLWNIHKGLEPPADMRYLIERDAPSVNQRVPII